MVWRPTLQHGERMSFDAERLIRLNRVAALAPSPDGQWLAVQVERLDAEGAAYVSDLWRVPLDGGPALRLTWGEQTDRAPAFDAEGGLCFLSARKAGPKDDKPKPQVWRFAPTGGEPTPLTDEPLGVVDFKLAAGVMVVRARRWPGVAEADQRAHQDAPTRSTALRYTARPVRFWDHWLSCAPLHLRVYRAGLPAQDLTPEGLPDAEPPAWDLAASGARLVVGQRRRGSDGILDHDLRIFDLAQGTERVVTAGDRTELEQPCLSPDGRWLLCVSNARRDVPGFWPRLERLDLDAKGAAWEGLAAGWDLVPRIARFADADSVLVTADRAGQVPVWRVGLDGTRTRLTDGGAHADPHWVGGRLVSIRSSATWPPEPFAADVELARLSGWTADEAAAVVVEPLECVGAQGDPVHGLLVRPAQQAGPLPLLLWIHGGPMSAHADVWHWRWNASLAAQHGYVVALPNPRGSTGYGERFMNEIWGNAWGGACFDDLMAFADAAAARPSVDATRQIAMGGSFGGYMCNWIGTRTDRFKALISHAGLAHFPQFRLTTDDGDWFAWGLGADATADCEPGFDTFSPHAHLDRYRTPTLVIHGEKDYRVPIGEALALFDGLQRRGVESELLVFPDENHWIMRPPNIVAWYRAWIEFAARYV